MKCILLVGWLEKLFFGSMGSKIWMSLSECNEVWTYVVEFWCFLVCCKWLATKIWSMKWDFWMVMVLLLLVLLLFEEMMSLDRMRSQLYFIQNVHHGQCVCSEQVYLQLS